MTKKILAFVAGVGVGYLVASLINNRKKYIQVYPDKNAEFEDPCCNEETEKCLDEITKDETSAVRDSHVGEGRDPKVITPRRRYRETTKPYDTRDHKDKYEIDHAEREHPLDDDEEEYRKYEEMSFKSKESIMKPHVITLEEFAEEMDNYDKLTIYYYEDDDTLADEDEQIIEDIANIIGDEALSRFGDGSDDPEVVYVRNDKLEIDYEVIRLSKSYAETVGLYVRDNVQDTVGINGNVDR
jgi:hypothetical protein